MRAGRPFYFITHPDVVIQPEVPIPDWPLSVSGRARMWRGLAQPWVRDITSIYASTERKAVEAAQILAGHLALEFHCIAELGENDRSSTGYLPRAEFESVADAFFARPGQSVRGWERALDAQVRIVAAVQRLAATDRTTGTMAIVSHGAVGALLWCELNGAGIDRRHDQPANGGGNYFRFTLLPSACTSWRPIDEVETVDRHKETMMQVRGRCHCGFITYTAEVDPQQVSVCHCTDCQMFTGSAYRVSVPASRTSFALLSGQPKVYVKTAESGTKRIHAFCPDCGSPVFSSATVDPPTYSLRVGCLEERADLPPRRQIWCRSAVPWSDNLGDVPQRDRQ